MRDVDGRSLTRVLGGDESAWENTTYSELVDSRGGFHSASRMVRSGDWKLSLFHDGDALPPILHNVAEDPDEIVNRVEDPAAAPVLQKLTSLLYDGWNPDLAAAESERLQHDYETLSSWGRTVRPDYFPETLAVPPEGTIETDVELR
jgi:arylsulfatase A-like enzyme